ncbi:MAG TPA: hypothetical protein VK186_17335 [Candidatus Deferrimicrobium sp.]|jgi:Skp family chaperone for outer membrane proteins|nr:hypothetical protein [Candidatus Kapabacteria bacterium]HLP60609.1 hypothetical protein [Candidatus Deferrimicrobium sp.]
MTEVFVQDNKDEEEDRVAQLAVLMKEAGEDARKRQKEAMDRHFEKIQAAIARGLARQKEYMTS